MFFQRKKIIAVHSGSFHADDVFACATVACVLDRAGTPYRIIRTRDQAVIDRADVVVDVGGIHDPVALRFDHHQQGGAGERDNAIPFAAFGLVWQHYGELLCASKEVAGEVDRRLVQPIDAIDNGISISETGDCGLREYGIHGIVGAYQCTWKQAGETKRQDESFFDLVNFFKNVLLREIEQTKHRLEMVDIIEHAYRDAERKDILEIPYHVTIGPVMQVLEEHKEVLFIVARSNTNWKAMTLRKESCSFENRMSFPKAWAGKRNKELQEITGVSDALFCHNALFLAVAESQEGAWQLAEKAVAIGSREAIQN